MLGKASIFEKWKSVDVLLSFAFFLINLPPKYFVVTVFGIQIHVILFTIISKLF